MLQTIAWTGSAARLLDQTKLPTETVYVDVANEKQMHDAIRRLVVRGAPAIGVAAAFGVYLGVKDFRPADGALLKFMARVNEVCDYLATSRPTAVNLFWAIDKMRRAARDAGRDSRSLDENLSVDLKMALLLRDVVGLSYTEIADSLEVTLATVKWRIYKAREEVQIALAREGITFGTTGEQPAEPAVVV